MDFSTIVTIQNASGGILGLTDFRAIQGHFEAGSPPNTIEANDSQEVRIKDDFGLNGSEGTCTYELHNPGSTEASPTFSLSFGDPTGSNDNWLRIANCSEPIVCDVQPYPPRGHPFHVFVNVNQKENVKLLASESLFQSKTAELSEKEAPTGRDPRIRWPEAPSSTKSAEPEKHGPPVRARYHFGFHAPLGAVDHKPIHELITIAAMIQSKYYTPKASDYNNLTPKQWELIRGVIWNDDPSCLLFNDSTTSNHDFGLGIEWLGAFESDDPRGMTRRSHFGDLQFLHAMAAFKGEAAQTTKDNLMIWMAVLYKLACGNQGISEQDTLASVFNGKFFDDSWTPSSKSSLKDLLLATTTKYMHTDIQMRALGVCIHIISDSFAVGHTKRIWLNPQDLDPSAPDGEILFKNGTWGRAGDILTFHCYAGQDDKKHTHYDELVGDMPKPKDLDTFNRIIGARTAIGYVTTLINFWYSKTNWQDGVEQFVHDQVFKLDANAQPGDNDD